MSYNYNNLFLDAMDTEQQKAIDEIKANKEFALKLINDLDKVFQTNYQVEDDQECTIIRIKRSPSNNWHGAFSFVVSKNGIKFNSNNLGYYHSTQFKCLGWLYEKYKDTGTTADNNFTMEGTTKHGHVSFVIPINRNGERLSDSLKDIIYLMEQNQYRKRF